MASEISDEELVRLYRGLSDTVKVTVNPNHVKALRAIFEHGYDNAVADIEEEQEGRDDEDFYLDERETYNIHLNTSTTSSLKSMSSRFLTASGGWIENEI